MILKRNEHYLIKSNEPPVIKTIAITLRRVIASFKIMKARIMVKTTLSLSIGATLDTSPIEIA